MTSVRREKPERTYKKVYSDYRKYKEALKKDFNKRCGYCDDDDYYSGGKRGFHIDHFVPSSKFPEYKCRYDNLVYSCSYCNIAKVDDWVSEKPDLAVLNNKGYGTLSEKTYLRVRHSI